MKDKLKKFLPHLAILLFAFLLYGNTLTYDYTLDDLIVIKDNAFTVKGFAGIPEIFSYDSFTGFFGKEKKLVAGGRYRPLSIATFAAEYGMVGGLNPMLSHLINIILYGITGILLYLIFKRIFPGKPNSAHQIIIALATALLFLAHPVHSEVVANIKGRDEIMALLFSLFTVSALLEYSGKPKVYLLLVANAALFLGLLSKENAAAFVILGPLALFYFTRLPWKKIIMIAATLLFTLAVFVFIRFLVLGYITGGKIPDELLNNPFLEASESQKYGTILYTLLIYLKLMTFPVTLTHDYYPYHIPLVEFTDLRAIVSLLIYAGLIIASIIGIRSKSHPSFFVWLYLLPLLIVSNLFFPIGTFMNERFVYFSSLGFIGLVVWTFAFWVPQSRRMGNGYYRFTYILFLTVILIYSYRTITRNPVWKDNFTLFSNDVLVSENSIKCNISAGGEWMKKAETVTDSIKRNLYYQTSEKYLLKSVEMYPRATNGLILYGNLLATYHKQSQKAIDQYLKVLSYDPFDVNAFNNSLKVLNSIDNAAAFDYKISVYAKLFSVNPDNLDVNYFLGKLYGQYKGKLDSAAFFLNRAAGIEPENTSVLKDLGIVYSMKGEFEKALDIFSRAAKLAPDDQNIRRNILTTQKFMENAKSD